MSLNSKINTAKPPRYSFANQAHHRGGLGVSVPLLFRSVGGPESAVPDHRMTSANKEGDKRPLRKEDNVMTDWRNADLFLMCSPFPRQQAASARTSVVMMRLMVNAIASVRLLDSRIRLARSQKLTMPFLFCFSGFSRNHDNGN